MYVYEVIVLAKGQHPETLTYFGSDPIVPMTRVKVPLRKKDVRGIVLYCEPLAHVKGELKSSEFALKKITSVMGPLALQSGYREAIEELADFYVLSRSALLRAMIPVHLFESDADFSDNTNKEKTDSEFSTERLLLAGALEERIGYYKTLIRESFARGQSLYIVVPTIEDAELLYSYVSLGIEQYTYTLHSGKKASDIRKNLQQISNAEHPIVVVGTVPYLAVPVRNLRALVLEHETSQSYLQIGKTPLDMRSVAYAMSEKCKIPLYVADTFPSIQAYALLSQRYLEQGRLFQLRFAPGKKCSIVDMKNEREGAGAVIGNTVQEKIARALQAHKDVFLFALKDGLGTQILCQDCGDTIRCTNCQSVLSLKKVAQGTVFWCSTCSKEYDSHTICARCGSWRLKELGIGVDVVYNEARRLFPDTPCYCVGKIDTVSDSRELQSVMGKRGAIIVGTPKALSLLPSSARLVSVVSFDSLLFYPHYAISERILTLSSLLADTADDELVIQTRTSSFPLLSHIEKGSLSEWYKEELQLRKKFDYPPYTHMLELRYADSDSLDLGSLKSRVEAFLAPYIPNYIEHQQTHEFSVVVRLPKTLYVKGKTHNSALGQALFNEKNLGARILWNSLSL